MSCSGAGAAARRLAMPVVLILICGLAGCADENSGDHQGIIGGPQTGTPEQSWLEIQRALNGSDAAAWSNAIGSTFAYEPDPVSAARYPHLWSAWGRAEELVFIASLLAADLEFDARLNVADGVCPAPQGSTVIWPAVEYAVVVAGAGGADPTTYRGVADLTFAMEGSFWYLSRWSDLYGATLPWNTNVVCPTLGELRAAYHAR